LGTKGGPGQDTFYSRYIGGNIATKHGYSIEVGKGIATYVAEKLTVSYEDHCSEIHEKKSYKYAYFMADCRDQRLGGYRVSGRG
jgi:hypothetical protein